MVRVLCFCFSLCGPWVQTSRALCDNHGTVQPFEVNSARLGPAVEASSHAHFLGRVYLSRRLRGRGPPTVLRPQGVARAWRVTLPSWRFKRHSSLTAASVRSYQWSPSK